MNKIWHPWHKWECYKAGFYSSCLDIGMKKETAIIQYYDFLSCLEMLEDALKCVILEWKYSCEHFLSNDSMNRIAWLGQASATYAGGIPSEARGGFRLLSVDQQKNADDMALKYLKIWENSFEKKNK